MPSSTKASRGRAFKAAPQLVVPAAVLVGIAGREYGISVLVLLSTPVRSPYPGANFASVLRPIPAGPGQTLPGGRFRCRNSRNKFFATRFAHFFLIKVPGVRPGFATLHYGLTPTAPRGRIWRKSPNSFRTHPSRLPHHWGWYTCHWGGSGTFS